jgi:hypothetical protein
MPGSARQQPPPRCCLNIADELIRLKESAERDRENVETVLGELSRILEEAMQG